MSSYQATITNPQPRASMRRADDRRAISHAITVAAAVILALLLLAITVAPTQGYGFNEPGQPAARPLPGPGL
jgi:hypothetical protein